MTLTKDQMAEFESVTRPVIEWMNNNCHPHTVVIIEPTSAALHEGIMSYPTFDYVKD